MNAEIVAIGTELLLGFVVNTDTVYLSRVLAGLGISCYHQVTVGDNPDRLSETLRTALDRSNLVITCGGLGPTVDDITLETIASTTGHQLQLNRKILRQIRSRFAKLKIKMPATNVRQAMIPEGSIIFPNSIGTAPGFLLAVPPREPQGKRPGKRLFVALPGPSAELIPMVEKYLVPYLRKYAGNSLIRSKTLKTTGRSESEIDAKVRDLLTLRGSVTLGIYAHPSQVDLRITAQAQKPAEADRQIKQIEQKIQRRLGNLIFGADAETLEAVVGKLLRKKGWTLSIAESCTGGLVQHRITEVPGSSDYFEGGVVTYQNKLKESILGVPENILKNYGAVSSQVARAMAMGIRRQTGSDLGVAITGIAGPTGSTRKKPVGLVYIALSTSHNTQVQRYLFSGTRSAIKFKASQAALNLLRLHCLGKIPARAEPVSNFSRQAKLLRTAKYRYMRGLTNWRTNRREGRRA